MLFVLLSGWSVLKSCPRPSSKGWGSETGDVKRTHVWWQEGILENVLMTALSKRNHEKPGCPMSRWDALRSASSWAGSGVWGNGLERQLTSTVDAPVIARWRIIHIILMRAKERFQWTHKVQNVFNGKGFGDFQMVKLLKGLPVGVHAPRCLHCPMKTCCS